MAACDLDKDILRLKGEVGALYSALDRMALTHETLIRVTELKKRRKAAAKRAERRLRKSDRSKA